MSSILEKYSIACIAWVFGLNGRNYIETMINVGKLHDTMRMVKDQIGTPTYMYDFVELLVDMFETKKYGYYHATNAEVRADDATKNGYKSGCISWYDFCGEFYKQ